MTTGLPAIMRSTRVGAQARKPAAELGVGICNIDQPLFHRSVKPAAHVTSKIGYVRLHGRNYKQWFSAKANVRERYDHLYSIGKLDSWADSVRQIAGETTDTHVVGNNHNFGKAAMNAVETSCAHFRSASEGSAMADRSLSGTEDAGRVIRRSCRFWQPAGRMWRSNRGFSAEVENAMNEFVKRRDDPTRRRNGGHGM